MLKKLGMLRVSREEEIAGLDLAEYGLEGYPEYPIRPEVNGAPIPAATRSVPQPSVSM